MKSVGGGFEVPAPRKGMPSPELSEREFKQRFHGQFVDPAFRPLDDSRWPGPDGASGEMKDISVFCRFS